VCPSEAAGGRYTFGDSEPAAVRLRLLSDVLAASSSALLRAAVGARPGLAVDLGCGPGYSTALVAEAAGATDTMGLDRSATFVAAAATQFPALRFVCHDVTQLPLPTAAPDVVFARLVLAHLPDPAAQIHRWAGVLAPGGRLLVEETEWIEAADPVLQAYEMRVRAVVASQGAPMTAGPLLADVGDGPDVRLLDNRVRVVAVPVATAARIYELNLASWRHDPYAAEHYAPDELDGLAAGLRDLAARASGDLTWGVRQLVLTRDG
jgi:trans-aconitate 2-methyltransferase